MKHLKLGLIITFCTFLYLTSCSKKSTPKPVTPASQVAGYWFGSADGGSFNQSFLLRNDGSVKVYDFYANPTSKDTTQAYDGIGTYTVTNNIITVNTAFPNGQTFSATAQVNLSSTPATLTFGNAASGYNGDVYRKQ